MKTWKASIQIGGKGMVVLVHVQARNFLEAQAILKGTYPPGTRIVSGPWEIH